MALMDALLLDPHPFEIWVARRADGLYGSGSLNDPWDASTTARFDDIMKSRVSAGTTVHLGPGTFTTAGYTDAAPTSGWQIKARVRILGAGRDITTIQLTGAGTANAHYFAVGHELAVSGAPNPMDFCEVADLTIDCNLAEAGGASTYFGAGTIPRPQ